MSNSYHGTHYVILFACSIPFGGVYIDYMTKLTKVSGGDIHSINHTFTSKHSAQKHRSATGAVQDIANGLADSEYL